MKILYLGYSNNKITSFFKQNSIDYVQMETKIDDTGFITENKFDMIISYRYRFILKKNVIDLNLPMINLHISYLPWNRGTLPNLWSFLENSPKGITIHYIDEGIDTGDIIYQEEFNFDENVTLAESYNILNESIQDLFIKNYSDIIQNKCPRKKQDKIAGSFHKLSDATNIIKKLEKNIGWNIKVSHLQSFSFTK